MIRTFIFDLDGTLVKTERLKALSYARAVQELCTDAITDEEVLQAFAEVVGKPRKEVAQGLMDAFHLEQAASYQMQTYHVSRPWQAFVQMRLGYYAAMVKDPGIIRSNQWPQAIELVQKAREEFCSLGLATMSTCENASYILQILEMDKTFDFIATADDVHHGKPDPEIYYVVAKELKVLHEECLVIEDSLSGVKAALAAGMHCIAVATPFTKQSLQEQSDLDQTWVVYDSEELLARVHDKVEQEKEKDNLPE